MLHRSARLSLSTVMTSHNARSRLFLTSQHISPSRQFSATDKTQSSIECDEVSNIKQGQKFASSFKQYAVDGQGEVISYFHDIPLDLDKEAYEANMVVEIPRWSNAKFEINTKLEGNPITQDEKQGKVRFVKNLFPLHGYIHNYGAFPQTWEDPTTKNEELDLYGDNDPIDVCEVGSHTLETGDIRRVKILGSLALIDDGELDWKVIVVDKKDPIASEIFDIHELFTHAPGLLETTKQWFRDYKLPDGKPPNSFAFSGTYKDRNETVKLIEECNSSWKRLVIGEIKGSELPNIKNRSLKDSPNFVSAYDQKLSTQAAYEGEAELPPDVNKSFFFSVD